VTCRATVRTGPTREPVVRHAGGLRAGGGSEGRGGLNVSHVSSVDCIRSPWTAWSVCSASCGPASSFRQRDVLRPALPGGACPGAQFDSRACFLGACPGLSSPLLSSPLSPLSSLLLSSLSSLFSPPLLSLLSSLFSPLSSLLSPLFSVLSPLSSLLSSSPLYPLSSISSPLFSVLSPLSSVLSPLLLSSLSSLLLSSLLPLLSSLFSPLSSGSGPS